MDAFEESWAGWAPSHDAAVPLGQGMWAVVSSADLFH